MSTTHLQPFSNMGFKSGISTSKSSLRILRRELFDHVIPFNERHLKSLLREYIGKYYNHVRTHQGIECQTPIVKEKPKETTAETTVLKAEPILGGMYHSYEKVA